MKWIKIKENNNNNNNNNNNREIIDKKRQLVVMATYSDNNNECSGNKSGKLPKWHIHIRWMYKFVWDWIVIHIHTIVRNLGIAKK